jgi:zinc protease
MMGVVAAPQPPVGRPTPVRFPEIIRSRLDNGLAVWSIPRSTTPVVAVLLLVNSGSSSDPADRPGLAGFTADLLDEGAGPLGAIELAEAFSGLGSHLEIEVAPDVTTFGLTALSRHFDHVVDLLADVIRRPRLEAADFGRVRDLRLNRLRQLSRSAGSAADRTFLRAVFGGHPYGHGALGTTASLQALDLEAPTAFWRRTVVPADATLIVVGDVESDDALATSHRVFGDWAGAAPSPIAPPDAQADPERRVLLVDRPGASQSELRVGHVGPSRRTPGYHAIVTMNAVLGGQFASRINRTLREERGVTYGARTTVEFRRLAGSFACETSVQADATADSVVEILRQFDALRQDDAVGADELKRAKASLTRGYARNFETPVQLGRAAAQLATYALPPSFYDDFVPAVRDISGGQAAAAARENVRAEDCAIVVVGDADAVGPALEGTGRDVVLVAPEF